MRAKYIHTISRDGSDMVVASVKRRSEWTWEVGGCGSGEDGREDRVWQNVLARSSRRRSFLFFLPIRIYAPLSPSTPVPISRPFSSAFFFLVIPLSLATDGTSLWQPEVERSCCRSIPGAVWRSLLSHRVRKKKERTRREKERQHFRARRGRSSRGVPNWER